MFRLTMLKRKVACVQMEMKKNYFHDRIAQAMPWQCDRKLPFFLLFLFLSISLFIVFIKKKFFNTYSFCYFLLFYRGTSFNVARPGFNRQGLIK